MESHFINTWSGNTKRIRLDSYLMRTDEHCDLVLNRKSVLDNSCGTNGVPQKLPQHPSEVTSKDGFERNRETQESEIPGKWRVPGNQEEPAGTVSGR